MRAARERPVALTIARSCGGFMSLLPHSKYLCNGFLTQSNSFSDNISNLMHPCVPPDFPMLWSRRMYDEASRKQQLNSKVGSFSGSSRSNISIQIYNCNNKDNKDGESSSSLKHAMVSKIHVRATLLSTCIDLSKA